MTCCSTPPLGRAQPTMRIAEPGMVLTIRYDDTGDTETFLMESALAPNTATSRSTPTNPR